MNQTLRTTPLPGSDIRPAPSLPPTYGAPQRDAINSVVDNVVSDICGKIAELRKTLDDIEQGVLEGAAAAKKALTDHIVICVRVNDEVMHMREVVNDIRVDATSEK